MRIVLEPPSTYLVYNKSTHIGLVPRIAYRCYSYLDSILTTGISALGQWRQCLFRAKRVSELKCLVQDGPIDEALADLEHGIRSERPLIWVALGNY